MLNLKKCGGKRMELQKFHFQKGNNRKKHTKGSKWLLLVHNTSAGNKEVEVTSSVTTRNCVKNISRDRTTDT